MDPLVSVVIPAWNCSRWIDEALESVYSQTYRNLEIVVVDDGSTDDTAQILGRHGDRIRYFHQPNAGTGAARNAGVAQARGELIAFLDNDDVWMPEKLERQVRALQGWPQCGLVFADGRRFNEAGVRPESLLPSRLEPWMDECRTEDPEVFVGSLAREFYFGCPISSASAVLARRSVIVAVGGFDEGLTITDDYDLWLRIARECPVIMLRTCLYLWRWRDDSQSGPVAERQYRWNRASIKVIEKHLADAPSDAIREIKRNLALRYWFCAQACFSRNLFVDAREMLRGCLRHDRLATKALVWLAASYAGPAAIKRGRVLLRRFREMRTQSVAGRLGVTDGGTTGAASASGWTRQRGGASMPARGSARQGDDASS